MLTVILLTAAQVGLPAWTKDVPLDNSAASEVKVRGPSAPKGLMLVKGAGPLTLTVEGPAQLELRVHVLTLKRGPRKTTTINVAIGDAPPQKLEANAGPEKKWRLSGQPLFGLAQPVVTTLNIPAGIHRVVLTPTDKKTFGLALSARRRKAAASEPEIPEPELPGPDLQGSSEPQIPEPELPDMSAPPIDSAEPDLPDMGEPALPGLDSGEPALPADTVEAAPTVGGSAGPLPNGFALNGTYSSHDVEVDGQPESFNVIDIDNGLRLNAEGPGVLKFKIHAHRNSAAPDTLEPVIVAILMDEILLQTVSVDQPQSDRYRVPGTDYSLSWRAELLVPIAPGRHSVQLTLSESAVSGASIQTSYESGALLESPVLTAEAPPSLTQTAPAPTVPATTTMFAVAGHIGVWIPAAIPSAGLALAAEGTVKLPLDFADLSAGLSLGIQWASHNQNYLDAQFGGQNSVSLSATQLPIITDIRWAIRLNEFATLELGAGLGAVIVWPTRSSGEISTAISPQGVAAGVAHIGAWIPVGPGEILLRAAVQATSSFGTQEVAGYSPAGAYLTAGYRYGLPLEL